MTLNAIDQWHLAQGAYRDGNGKTIEQQLAEQGLRPADYDEDGWYALVWNNDAHKAERVWATTAHEGDDPRIDPEASPNDFPGTDTTCDLCGAPDAEYDTASSANLCEAHLIAIMALESETETAIPLWPVIIPGCAVCGLPAVTEWAGDDPYCQIHLDELLALDTSDTPRRYAVTGTLQLGEARLKTSAIIDACSKLEAARMVLASIVLPWRASWADVYVVQR